MFLTFIAIGLRNWEKKAKLSIQWKWIKQCRRDGKEIRTRVCVQRGVRMDNHGFESAGRRNQRENVGDLSAEKGRRAVNKAKEEKIS